MNQDEPAQLIHNMSAPPVSKISIGSHRQGKTIIEIRATCFPTEQPQWDQTLALQLGYNSPRDLIAAANQALLRLNPPPVAVTTKGAKATHIIDDPLLAIAILPRCMGHLFMLNNPIRLQAHLYDKTVCFAGSFAAILNRSQP